MSHEGKKRLLAALVAIFCVILATGASACDEPDYQDVTSHQYLNRQEFLEKGSFHVAHDACWFVSGYGHSWNTNMVHPYFCRHLEGVEVEEGAIP